MILGLLLGLISAGCAWANGNGSSGIGNRTSIDENVDILMPVSQPILKMGNTLVDARSGKSLLRIDSIHRNDLVFRSDHLARSRLGDIPGYEYLPETALSNRGAQNFWIICGKESSSCLKLIPLSNSDPKVLNLIGGLRESPGSLLAHPPLKGGRAAAPATPYSTGD